jgi:hypothetical protein
LEEATEGDIAGGLRIGTPGISNLKSEVLKFEIQNLLIRNSKSAFRILDYGRAHLSRNEAEGHGLP